MKLRSLNKHLLTALASLLLLPLSVQAADLTVTCDSGGPCNVSPANTALFNDNNLVPGATAVRSIEVINTSLTEACQLSLATTNVNQNLAGFADKVFSAIQQNGADVHGATSGSNAIASITLANVFNAPVISLDTIGADSTVNYNWLITLDPTTDDSFQGARAEFDFDLNFQCQNVVAGIQTSPTPTGQVAGTIDQPPAQKKLPKVLGAATLAPTGTFVDNALWSLLIIGLAGIIVSLYKLDRLRNRKPGLSSK